MRRLVDFLVRNHVLILFLLLEGIAFSQIVRSQSFQRYTWVNSSNQATGAVLEQVNQVEDYFFLEEQNQRLARENAALLNTVKSSYLPLFAQRDTVVDTLYAQRYQFQEAEVIHSSYNKRNNYLTINRGSLHGIKANMGVFGEQGVIGIIKDVSPHFSTVLPLLHKKTMLSGRLKGTGFFGSVTWDGRNYRVAQWSDVPQQTPVRNGAIVETDSRSRVFPTGIPIGKIVSFELDNSGAFWEVELELTTDFSKIDLVYVVEDLMKRELEQLELKLDEGQ